MYSSYKRETEKQELMASPSSRPPSPSQNEKKGEIDSSSVETQSPQGEAETEEKSKNGVLKVHISKDSAEHSSLPPLVSTPLPIIEQEPINTSVVLSNSFKLPRPETSKVHVRSPPIQDTRPSTASVVDSRPVSSSAGNALVIKNPLALHGRPASSGQSNPVVLKNPLMSHNTLHHTPKATNFLPPVASASHIQTVFGKNGVFTITNNNLTKTQPIIGQQPLTSFTLDSEEALKSNKSSSEKGSAESTRTQPMLSSASSSAGKFRDEDRDSLNKYRRRRPMCCEGLCDAASLACCFCCSSCNCDLFCLLCRICTTL